MSNMPSNSAFLAQVEEHVRDYFSEHIVTEHIFRKGPTRQLVPEFRVLCAEPSGGLDFYTYLSIGASLVGNPDGRSLEFLVTSNRHDDLWVELLTMTAYYHSTESLELGHTFPIGHPLLADASCDHILVSLPYPFGPSLEVCCLNHTHVHFLWLLPITEAEKRYRMENGLEALEQRFDDQGIDFLNVNRPSIA